MASLPPILGGLDGRDRLCLAASLALGLGYRTDGPRDIGPPHRGDHPAQVPDHVAGPAVDLLRRPAGGQGTDEPPALVHVQRQGHAVVQLSHLIGLGFPQERVTADCGRLVAHMVAPRWCAVSRPEWAGALALIHRRRCGARRWGIARIEQMFVFRKGEKELCKRRINRSKGVVEKGGSGLSHLGVVANRKLNFPRECD